MDSERQEWLAEEFGKHYGFAPGTGDQALLWAQAPGRVDLMGSHTDYNHGFVLAMSIAYDTLIAARPRNDGRVRIASANLLSTSEFDLSAIRHDPQAPWSDYVRGVAWSLQQAGYALSGFDGMVHSSVPMASGLSSSAALEVATARLFDNLGSLNLDPVRLAVLCQKAENEFVGMNCGILDQYTSSVCPPGQSILLDCRHLTSEVVPIHPSLSVVICDTRAKRELTGSEYPERRAACERTAARLADIYPAREGQRPITHLRDVTLEELLAVQDQLPETDFKRARFVIEENQRVLDLANLLPKAEIQPIQALYNHSYQGAKDLYEIVSQPMEQMMRAIQAAPGIIGARGAGAGFGGCLVAIVHAGQEAEFGQSVKEAYLRGTGIEPGIYLA